MIIKKLPSINLTYSLLHLKSRSEIFGVIEYRRKNYNKLWDAGGCLWMTKLSTIPEPLWGRDFAPEECCPQDWQFWDQQPSSDSSEDELFSRQPVCWWSSHSQLKLLYKIWHTHPPGIVGNVTNSSFHSDSCIFCSTECLGESASPDLQPSCFLI